MKKIRKSIAEIKDEIFDALGGFASSVKYYKRHPSAFYPDYFKMQPQPLVQNNVNVRVEHDGEAARAKLADAIYRIIDARRIDGADPACYVDGERINDGYIIEPSTADPRPVTPDVAPQAADPAPDSNSVELKSPKHGSPFSRGGVATTAAAGPKKESMKTFSSVAGIAAGAALDEDSDNRSTTEKYLSWSGHRKPP